MTKELFIKKNGFIVPVSPVNDVRVSEEDYNLKVKLKIQPIKAVHSRVYDTSKMTSSERELFIKILEEVVEELQTKYDKFKKR